MIATTIARVPPGEAMSEDGKLPRRSFLKQAAATLGAATQVRGWPTLAETRTDAAPEHPASAHHRTEIPYPRVFREEHLKMISFPLGGVGAGSLGLGGRGQLRDWEIFNRPNQGFAPPYA